VSAPRSRAISEQGSRDALCRRWKDNIEQIRPLQGGVLGESDVDEVQLLAQRFLAGRAPLLECSRHGSAAAASWTGTGTC